MEDFQTKINTLNALLPQQVPFVIAQVSEALKIAKENSTNFERDLDITIKVTELVNKYSKGDLLYNYTPIILALLTNLDEGVDISAFDTINHDIPISLALVKNMINGYENNTKGLVNNLATYKDNSNVILVVLANLLKDLEEGRNALNIAYTIQSLNMSHVQFVDGTYILYCKLLEALGSAQF